MTPREYVQFSEKLFDAIRTLRELDVAARESALAAPVPANLRPARSEDIVPGAVIWYHAYEEERYWQIVSEPLHYGDAFKAYEADDGCRYGLDGAWVEVD